MFLNFFISNFKAMRNYFIKFIMVATAIIVVHFSIALFVRAPIAAEYWVREMIIIKHDLGSRFDSPKIIFLGGSYALFGIDAAKMEKQLQLPVLNFGLHAGMRLDWLLREGDAVTKSGDILVMALEQPYYGCRTEAWTYWQVQNSLAWYPAPFESLQLVGKLKVLYLADLSALVREELRAAIEKLVTAELIAARLEALAPSTNILARYRSGHRRTAQFNYSAYNLDDHGSMLHNVGAYLDMSTEPQAELTNPGRICPEIKIGLQRFISKLEKRNVRVLFVHAPYVLDGLPPTSEWQTQETLFSTDIKDLGADVLDNRSEMFFPSKFFFNTPLHLNEEGREINTQNLIAHLRRRGIGRSD
jgi:hypothetical protein